MFKPLIFNCYRNRTFVGKVQGSSQRDATNRARGLYGRVELILAPESRGMGVIGRRADTTDDHRTHGRAPCRTPGFEARREAEIAAWLERQA